MKIIYSLLVCLCCWFSLPLPAAIQQNRFTLTPDGMPVNGSTLFNVPVDNEVNVQSFGAVGDGITDDTAAFNAALNYVVTNMVNGGTIYCPIPSSKYLIAGPLTGGGANSQLVVPPTPGYPNRSVTVRIRGPIFQAQSMYILSSGGNLDGGAIIKSTLVGSAGGAVLGTWNTNPGNFNPVTLILENLTFETPVNGNLIGINMRKAFALQMKGVRVWTGQAPFDVTSAPTQNQSVAIATPFNNNAAYTVLNDISVCGFFTAYELSEHTSADNISAWACLQGATFPGSYHSINIGRIGIYHCQYGLGVTGASRVAIAQLDIEHNTVGGSWKNPLWDVYDPTNLLSGNAEWSVIAQGVGVSHTFVKSGGTGLLTREIGTPYPSTGGSGAPAQVFSGAVDPSGAPAGGVTTAIYINTTSGATFLYYGGAWH